MDKRAKNFYTQLNTLTVGDRPSSQIDTIGDPIALLKENIEVMDALIKINKATLRDGGYIPGTGIIKSVTVTEADNNKDVFIPAVGEVYAVLAADHTYGTGQNGANLILTDGTNEVIVADSSGGGDFNDHGFRSGTFIDNKLYLRYKAVNITGGTSKLEVALMRVR